MKTKLLNWLSLILALAGGVMAFGDKVEIISWLDPRIAHIWPFILVMATSIDRIGKIVGDALDDGDINGSYKAAQSPADSADKPYGARNQRFVPVLLCCLLLTSCATDTLDIKANRRGRITNAVLQELGRVMASVAWNTFQNVATAKMTGEKVDMGHAAAANLWAASTTIDGAAALQHIINAASDHQLQPIANKAAEVYAAAAPKTPAESARVINAIAKAVSDTALSIK